MSSTTRLLFFVTGNMSINQSEIYHYKDIISLKIKTFNSQGAKLDSETYV